MQRIKVLVVDDSVVVRRLVADALSADPAIEIVGVAANGQIALAKVAQLEPHVITMDVEMPVMDGIETVRELRRTRVRTPIIMFSTLTDRGASATLDALAAGATDYVTKPANVGSVQESMARVADELVPRIKALAPRGTGVPAGPTASRGTSATAARTAAPAAPAARGAVVRRPRPERNRPVRAVVVGSSTGGPEALSRFVRALEVPLPVPVLAVQHMPPVFTRQLAQRLDRVGASTVVESAGDEVLVPGTVYLAPGDHHLEVRATAGNARTVLHQGPPVNFCRPAVDVLFRSAAATFGGDVLAVVLTGMGSDGRSGCEDVVRAGGTVVVQDEPTSVVWGMPGAVAHAGLAHEVVPLDDVASVVAKAVGAVAAGGPR